MTSILNLNVNRRLVLGFGIVICVMFIVSLYTFLHLKSIERLESRLLDIRVPTVLAGARLENGINLSSAGLRGYIVLGNDPVKAQAMKNLRAAGWAEIDNAIDEMRKSSRSWTNPTNIKNLSRIEFYIKEFRVAQQEVEDIAHTIQEIPAYSTLLTQANPRANKILSAITVMIDEEATLQATPQRKILLKLMADSRGSFAIGLANIRAYLLYGDTKFRDSFNAKFQVNNALFKQISTMSNIMTASQSIAWKQYSKNLAEFGDYAQLIFTQRSAPNWNLANYWLGSKEAPKAQAIMDIIDEMRDKQATLKQADRKLLEQESFNIQMAVLFGGIISLIIGMLVTKFISNSITVPLQDVVSRAKEITSGDLTGNTIPPVGNDELTELTHAINEMHISLYETRQQLVHAEKMASLGQLAAGVAHEINTPVGFVTSNLHSLKQYTDEYHRFSSQVSNFLTSEPSPAQDLSKQALLEFVQSEEIKFINEDTHDLLAESIEGLEQVKNIVKDLKQFSRVDSDDKQWFDINDCITTTLHMVSNELKYHCNIQQHLGELPKILINVGKISQVLTNLLINAGQAINEGGQITITSEKKGSNVVVSIADNGSGINPDHLSKLFDPFFTTKEEGLGTGLGLSISYGIIKSHDGNITVTSEANKGTCFKIVLPISDKSHAVKAS
jgi:signal transduction histidine kinase